MQFARIRQTTYYKLNETSAGAQWVEWGEKVEWGWVRWVE